VKKLVIWFVLLSVALIGAVVAYWMLDLRWRPKTITANQAEITRILEQSGWVSPGLTGPKIYMIGFRACSNCIQTKADLLPDLRKAGVDTRVIEFVRRDANGVEQSTPAERATVAELWTNRSWRLMEQWDAAPIDGWTAPGIPPADGDIARTAVVEASRDMVDQLRPLLKANGIGFGTPVMIWWTRDGTMHGCSCGSRASWRFIRKDLGAE
jgi:hypothetical protein